LIGSLPALKHVDGAEHHFLSSVILDTPSADQRSGNSSPTKATTAGDKSPTTITVGERGNPT